MRPGTRLAALGRPGRRPIELRNGLTLRTSSLLDLLILKETLCDDVYRLAALDEETALVVDVGAGFGDVAILAARRCPQARVLAFEPHPAAFALLQANLRSNGITNVEAHRVAIGPAPAGRRLDEFVGGCQVDLLKLDCEGGELDALGTLALGSVRRVVAEYHLHLVPDEDRLLTELLAGNGFGVELEPDPYDPAIGYVYAGSAGP